MQKFIHSILFPCKLLLYLILICIAIYLYFITVYKILCFILDFLFFLYFMYAPWHQVKFLVCAYLPVSDSDSDCLCLKSDTLEDPEEAARLQELQAAAAQWQKVQQERAGLQYQALMQQHEKLQQILEKYQQLIQQPANLAVSGCLFESYYSSEYFPQKTNGEGNII